MKKALPYLWFILLMLVMRGDYRIMPPIERLVSHPIQLGIPERIDSKVRQLSSENTLAIKFEKPDDPYEYINYNDSLNKIYQLPDIEECELKGNKQDNIIARFRWQGTTGDIQLQPVSPIILTIIFDNDVYFGTDYYYTNGAGFELVHPAFKKLPLSGLLLPSFDFPETYYSLCVVQNMYTPTQLDTDRILSGDRPFASYIYIGHKKTSIDPLRKLKMHSELLLGVIGPGALGGYIQDLIHDDRPVGWANQIQNDVLFNYNCEIQKNMLSRHRFELTGLVGGKLGTLYNQFQAGARINYGNFSAFHGIHNFNAHIHLDKKPFRYNFFAQANINLIAYDATLQGGMLNNHSVYILNSNEVSGVVGQWSAGLALQFKWFSFKAEQFFITAEHKGSKPHRWLRISTSFMF